MNYIKSILLSAAVALGVAGCDMGDFGDINVNPNKPSVAPTSSLFVGSARYVRTFVMTSSSYDPWPMLWTGYLSESKNNQYGPLGTTTNFSTTYYYLWAIGCLNDIIEQNTNEETRNEATVLAFGSNENQIAVATTLRSFFFMTLSDILGAIPYSEAFKGVSDDNWLPKFDSQEYIYEHLDQELQEAYAMMDTSSGLGTADIFYGGDISKWKKFNASVRMMMAIKMADVDPVNGKARFQKAYTDGAMTDVADGFHYTFDSNSEYYSWMYYQGNKGYTSAGKNFVPNKVLVDALKDYRDPRLFAYCTLDGYKGLVEGDPTDFDAYKGVPFGLGSNDEVNAESQGCCSVADSYCEAQATYGIITTARTLLVEAEAAELGWISADPKALYEAGIRASFEFAGATGVEDYLTSEKVVLSSSRDEALKQIVMQRFLAGFMTDGIEAWSDWRRYNLPVLPIYSGQSSAGYTVYPYRMQYSDTDCQYNVENSQAAINAYLGGKDDRWVRLWWDVADNE